MLSFISDTVSQSKLLINRVPSGGVEKQGSLFPANLTSLTETFVFQRESSPESCEPKLRHLDFPEDKFDGELFLEIICGDWLFFHSEITYCLSNDIRVSNINSLRVHLILFAR